MFARFGADKQAAHGVIGDVAERAVLDRPFVTGERQRLLTAAFMIRAILRVTLVPDAEIRDAVTALSGDRAPVTGRWCRCRCRPEGAPRRDRRQPR